MQWTFYELDTKTEQWPMLRPVCAEETDMPMLRVKELRLHAFGAPKEHAFFVSDRHTKSNNAPPFRRAVLRILKDPQVSTVDGCIRNRADATARNKSRRGRRSDTANTLALVGLHKAAHDDTRRLTPGECMKRGVMAWCGMDMADAGTMTAAERNARLAWWNSRSEDERAAMQATALDPSVPYEGPLGAVLNRVQPVQPQSEDTRPASTAPSIPQAHDDTVTAALLDRLRAPSRPADPSYHVTLSKDWPSVSANAVVWCGLPADEARAMPVHERRNRYEWWCNLPLEERQSLNAQARAAAEQGQI